MRYRVLPAISGIAAADWNRLVPDSYPFVRHEFLAALERHGCVSPARGWTAQHLVLEQDGSLVAAAPLYLKTHSFGEFVFDWSWAEASQRLGRDYYPKLLCAVPFNPVTGPRLLAVSAEARRSLADAVLQQARVLGLSSLHTLFIEEPDRQALQAAGCLLRRDCQYHWFNDGYRDFGDFLARLPHAQRKNIRRERRRVAEAGIRCEVLHGAAIPDALWPELYRFYAHTYEERGQPPYLDFGCLLSLAAEPGLQMRVILARQGEKPVGMALCYVGGDTLYGRHWGCDAYHHSLHFETCYYQGIEYCIREGLARYDAGAQGEHKLQRGFQPVPTWSAHWLAEPRLSRAVASHLQREGQLLDAYVAEQTRPRLAGSR